MVALCTWSSLSALLGLVSVKIGAVFGAAKLAEDEASIPCFRSK